MTERGPGDINRADIASKGGRARAAKLSAQERSGIAKEAANKRWAERKRNTEDIGSHRVLESFKSVLDLAGMKLPCAIIRVRKGSSGFCQSTA